MIAWSLWKRSVDGRVQRADARANARPDLRILDPGPEAARGEGCADTEAQVGIGGLQLAFRVKNASKIGTYEVTAQRDREGRSE